MGDKVEKQIRLKSNWTKGEIVFDDDPIGLSKHHGQLDVKKSMHVLQSISRSLIVYASNRCRGIDSAIAIVVPHDA